MNMNLITEYGEAAAGIRDVLLSEAKIQARVSDIARQISTDYAGKNPIFVGVLKGVLFFMADLLRKVTIPVEVDFIAISSFTPETRQQGIVRLVKDLEASIAGRHVVFVEDVIDTGLTLNYLLRNLKARQPASLEVCVLFNKPERRLIDIPLKYQGFDLPDEFVVGYGLDLREKYRNLPFVGVLSSNVLK